MTVVDVASDTSLSFTKQISDSHELPKFVKEAAEEDLTVASPNPDLYADAKRKKFANISGAATWLNYAMFRKQEHLYSPAERASVTDAFKKHANYWGVSSELLRLDAKLKAQVSTPAVKTAADSDYALVVKTADGQTLRRCYVGDRDGLVKSAQWLIDNTKHLSYPDRRKVAQEILSRAELLEHSFDANTAERLHKTAGVGVATPHNVYLILTSRSLLAEGDTKGLLYKIAHDCKDGHFDLQDGTTLLKLAEQIDELDRANGWHVRYDKHELTLPEDIYDITHSKVAELKQEFVETATGCVYSKSQFAGIPIEPLADFVGLEFSKRASVDDTIDPDLIAVALKTANKKVAGAFDRFMAERGVQPVRQPERLVRYEPEAEAWAELAGVYQPSS